MMMNRAREMNRPFNIVNINVIGERSNPSGYEWRVVPTGATSIDSIEKIVDDLAMVAGCPIRLMRREGGVYLRYVRPGAVSANYDVLLEAVKERAAGHIPMMGLGFLPNGRPLMARLDRPNACHVGAFSQTQSGKTNMCQVALATLAAGCHHRHVQIVIIDHKANKSFAALLGKHVHAHAINKPQWLNALRDVRRLMDYRREHLEEIDSWSHVVVYCDELGEVAHESGSEITDQFDSIARRGAGLKVHMFVATQRPSSDEVKTIVNSQIAFRIVGRCSSAREAVTAAGVGGTGAHLINRIGHFIAVKADQGGGHLDFFVPHMDVPALPEADLSKLANLPAGPSPVSSTKRHIDVTKARHIATQEPADTGENTPSNSQRVEHSEGVTGFTEIDDHDDSRFINESDVLVADLVARIMFIKTGASDGAKISQNEILRRCKLTDKEGNPITRLGGGSLHPRWKMAMQIVEATIDTLSK